MPDDLDLVGLEPAEARHRGLGEAGRDADAQLARDELQKRPAAGFVEGIEPAGEQGRQVDLVGRRKPLDDLGEGGHVGGRVVMAHQPFPSGGRGHLRRRPHQRDRFRQITHVVARELEQHRVGALQDEAADQAGLGVAEAQRTRDGGERPAALGVGRAGEEIRHQPQLRVAARLVGETVEERREAVHGAVASASTSASLSPSSP
jgi:hypothetical protein